MCDFGLQLLNITCVTFVELQVTKTLPGPGVGSKRLELLAYHEGRGGGGHQPERVVSARKPSLGLMRRQVVSGR
eukprot:352606-Chlamydomonas_euryale.AAC.2